MVVTACRGAGSVISAAGVQAALLADVGTASRIRVAPCAAPCKCPMLDHSSFRISSQALARHRSQTNIFV